MGELIINRNDIRIEIYSNIDLYRNMNWHQAYDHISNKYNCIIKYKIFDAVIDEIGRRLKNG